MPGMSCFAHGHLRDPRKNKGVAFPVDAGCSDYRIRELGAAASETVDAGLHNNPFVVPGAGGERGIPCASALPYRCKSRSCCP